MNPAALINFAIQASIVLMVLSLGLRSSSQDAMYLLRKPGLLVRSLIAMNVVMPLLVLWLVTSFDLRPPVKIALVALAISPVPPFLPAKLLKLTSSNAYACGLLVATALLSVLFVPSTITFIDSRTAGGLQVDPWEILTIVLGSVLVPLLVGVIVRRLWPEFAAKLRPLLDKLAILMLVVALVPVVINSWSAIRALVGDGTLLSIVAFTVLGLAVGHVLGGPDPNDRSVLALATASRHPAVAIAVARSIFPDQTLVPAAVLLALLAGLIAAAPYTAWRKRLHSVGPTSNCPPSSRL